MFKTAKHEMTEGSDEETVERFAAHFDFGVGMQQGFAEWLEIYGIDQF